MSTLLVCSHCGGIIGGSGANGRPCMCSRVSGSALKSPASAGDSSTSGGVAVQKVCSVCGVDVSSRKRMKDSITGRYWCYECGIADKSRKGQGMMMTCSACKKSFPPVKMVRSPKDPETWVCDGCADNLSGKKKPEKPEKHSEDSSKVKSAASPVVVHKKAGGSKSKTPMVVGAVALFAAVAAVLWMQGIL